MKKGASLLLFIFTLGVIFVAGQGKTASSKLWREIDDTALQQKLPQRTVIPNAYRAFTLDKAAIQSTLRSAPLEFSGAARSNSSVLELPMPDGTIARFSIEESPIFEAGLAAKHPEIKTYHGKNVDDPTVTARFDFMPSGFHAVVFTHAGTVLVDPYAVGDTSNYISYSKDEVKKTGEFSCNLRDQEEQMPSLREFSPEASSVVSGTTLRTYRLALAADAEYTNVFRQAGDTDAQARARALEQMVLIMNRVNAVYEREVAIRLVMIANEDAIIYTDTTTDPYTNENGSTMLGQNQTNLDTVIGSDNYDIGHVFSTGGGGIAGVGVPCRSNLKARGVTGLPNPIGDPFAIDYVAHEMGHQFGAGHTFNVGNGSCGPQRSSSSAYEPGSAITIMGYAGICSGQNLASNSIDTFHVKSIEQIVAYSTGTTGNACAVPTLTGNTAPDVTIETTGLNVPKQTPFYLTASASDADGDSVTYDWQEYDLGVASTSAGTNSDADGQARPLFRPYLPTTGSTRTFPSLQYILNNANVPPTSTGSRFNGEILPSITRTMIFQVIVRDNRANGGGVRSRSAAVNVDATSGPFVITAPDTAVSWAGNSTQTVTWNVANTDNATVNAQNVKISLSTDGGNTFSTVLLASTPNDGTQTITVPNINTTQARIKVEAVDNIFFDISGANFTINASNAATRTPFDFDGDGKADVSVFRPSTGIWYLNNSAAGFSGAQFGANGDKIVPADFDGDGKADLAVYRNGTWFVQRSQAGFTGLQFGASDDVTVPADFDGDGKAELAVFRPSTGIWYIYNLATNQVSTTQFGQAGDIPVAADFDGDGKANYAIFRPSAATWYIARATGVPSQNFDAIPFGANGDKTVVADYDGDGKTDVAVFRPSNGIWYILRSRDGLTGVQFGVSGDAPSAADYDGDGKADVAVFRNGTWYINRSQAGFTGVAFGASTDQAAPNAFIR